MSFRRVTNSFCILLFILFAFLVASSAHAQKGGKVRKSHTPSNPTKPAPQKPSVSQLVVIHDIPTFLSASGEETVTDAEQTRSKVSEFMTGFCTPRTFQHYEPIHRKLEPCNFALLRFIFWNIDGWSSDKQSSKDDDFLTGDKRQATLGKVFLSRNKKIVGKYIANIVLDSNAIVDPDALHGDFRVWNAVAGINLKFFEDFSIFAFFGDAGDPTATGDGPADVLRRSPRDEERAYYGIARSLLKQSESEQSLQSIYVARIFLFGFTPPNKFGESSPTMIMVSNIRLRGDDGIINVKNWDQTRLNNFHYVEWPLAPKQQQPAQ